MNKQDLYNKITSSILAKLQEGVIPWRKSWRTGIPANFVSKRYYNGINFVYLSLRDFPSPYYLTFLQTKQLGGFVNKGEEGSLVVFWKIYETPDNDDSSDTGINRIPILRYSYVFNLQQTSLYSIDERPAIISAEIILQNFKEKPVILHNFRNCYYSIDRDVISVPVITDFDSPAEFYSSLYHEVIHWTGHAKRLNRNMSHESKVMAFEELVAEIGSAYLCGLSGIMPATLNNQASYINSWIKAVNEDNLFLIKAATTAKQAINYLLDESIINTNCVVG